MKHWAFKYIGAPYVRGAQGPETFDCWGFVRWAFRHHLGVPEMPLINVGEGDNLRAIRHAALVSGWRPVEDNKPQENDIALMDDVSGGKHVGLIVKANGRLRLIHSMEKVGVCVIDLKETRFYGLKNLNFWRKMCS